MGGVRRVIGLVNLYSVCFVSDRCWWKQTGELMGGADEVCAAAVLLWLLAPWSDGVREQA